MKNIQNAVILWEERERTFTYYRMVVNNSTILQLSNIILAFYKTKNLTVLKPKPLNWITNEVPINSKLLERFDLFNS
jgi:hypothetical protein